MIAHQPIFIMAIREDLVTSAVSDPLFATSQDCDTDYRTDAMSVPRPDHRLAKSNLFVVLQDPSVASSSVENRIGFLRSKNLTQEEIDVALARSGGSAPPTAAPSAPYPSAPAQPPQQYYQPYPPQAWQPPPPPPRRDWRDWFIMATVVGGVGYGLYSLGKVCCTD